MAMTKAEALAKIPDEHLKTLAAEGINAQALIDWVLAHGCDVVAAAKKLIPLLPISDTVKTALLTVLEILCPA